METEYIEYKDLPERERATRELRYSMYLDSLYYTYKVDYPTWLDRVVSKECECGLWGGKKVIIANIPATIL